MSGNLTQKLAYPLALSLAAVAILGGVLLATVAKNEDEAPSGVAGSEQEQREIFERQWPVARYGKRFLQLALDNPGTATSLQALIKASTLLRQCSAPADREQLVDVVQLFRQHHHSSF